MRAWLLAAACLKHCLNCCLCISAAIRLWFLGIFHVFCAAVPCGVHLRPAFNPIVEKPPEQIFSIDFYARMTNNSCHTFAYSKPQKNKKTKRKAVIESSTAVADGTRNWQDPSRCHYLKTDMYSSLHSWALSPKFSQHFTFYFTLFQITH